MSMALIALCNAGVQNELRHIDTLLSRQKPDGSYLNGPGQLLSGAKQWIKGSLVNFICKAKSLSKQDVLVVITCSSKVLQ